MNASIRLAWHKFRWMFSNRVIAQSITVADSDFCGKGEWLYISGQLFRVHRLDGGVVYVY